jgi:hypothetical protein
MRSKITILLLVSAFASTTTAALAGSLHAKRHDVAYFNDRDMTLRKWQLHRLYGQREGYLPDYRGCFPGSCRDNPYY